MQTRTASSLATAESTSYYVVNNEEFRVFGFSHLQTRCECFAFSVNPLYRFSHLLSTDITIFVLVEKSKCRMLARGSAWAPGQQKDTDSL